MAPHREEMSMIALYEEDQRYNINNNSINSDESSLKTEETNLTSSTSTSNMESPRLVRRSSLKKLNDDELHICTKRQSWKSMPVPDLDKIQQYRRSQSVNSALGDSPQSSRRSVSFHEIQIREYDQTLGDHPNVSYGPAIQLDWQYEECEPLAVDLYEDNRGKRRNLRQMGLNYYQRKNLLMWKYGVEEEALKKAARQSSKAARQRALTQFFLPVAKVEEVLCSAKRKTARVLVKNNNKRSTDI